VFVKLDKSRSKEMQLVINGELQWVEIFSCFGLKIRVFIELEGGSSYKRAVRSIIPLFNTTDARIKM
jgi:hypothetical protein